MGEIAVRIGGRDYALDCAEGREDRLKALARRFDGEVTRIRDNHPRLEEGPLLLLAALDILETYDDAEERLAGMTSAEAAEEWAASRIDAARERIVKALEAWQDASG